MQIHPHSAADYAGAMQALLPPGAAWAWSAGSFGFSMLEATGQELARVEAATQGVLDNAIETHRPSVASYHINAYRAKAQAALTGTVETMPRKMAGAGSRAGVRLWSVNGSSTTFPVPLVQVDHLVGPLRVGSHAGDRCWGTRSRHVLRVRYYRSVVPPHLLWDALKAFKQAHVFLVFEDITGHGGEVSYAQD